MNRKGQRRLQMEERELRKLAREGCTLASGKV
jgi:hypothetical protein